MPTLHIFTIHTASLKARGINVHGHIQTIRTKAMTLGYRVKPYLILKPDSAEVESKVEELQKLVSYEPVGDPVFDSQRQALGVEVISNGLKHKEAWTRITELAAEDDICMVLEDDLFVVKNGIENLEHVLKNVATNPEWDMVFLGITDNDTGTRPGLKKFSEFPIKVLPSKESYLIRPSAAKKLIADVTDKIRFSLRIQLSYFFAIHPEFRVFYSTARCFLDGSKLGLFPSTIHSNNILLYNREFMELLQYVQDPSRIPQEIGRIQQIFQAVLHLNNPDLMHLYGVILYKFGKIKESEQVLLQAIREMKTQNGIINARSDLMNNMIQIFRHRQEDIPDLLKKPSKYSDPIMASSDY